jgi:hypothetical protein
MELMFWRNKQGHEIDFILLINRKPILIEVKSNLKEISVPPAMKIFIDHYPETEWGVVFSESLRGEVTYKGKTIFFKHLEEVDAII